MIRYLIILAIVVSLANIAEKYDTKRPFDISDGRVKHTKITAAIFIAAAAVIIITAGLRYPLGADFFSYYGKYEKFGLGNYDAIDSEPGIGLIYALGEIIDGNPQTPIFLCSAFTLGLIMYTIYKYTDRLTLATFILVTIGVWGHSFNAIRQFLAVAIVFCGFNYIKERKFVKYAILVFVAYLFHRSAIVMILPYFVANNKISARNIVLMILGTIAALFLYDLVFDAVGVIMESNLESEYATRDMSPLRIAVSILPAVLGIYIYYSEGKDPRLTMYINMLIIHASIMTMSAGSAYFGRFGSYTIPFLCISIPEICKKLKGSKQIIIIAVILIGYLIYWLYDNTLSLGSYTWIFDFN